MATHSFTNFPSSGVDAGVVQNLTPTNDLGAPASAIGASLRNLYNRTAHNVPAAGIWVDDASIVGSLVSYVDSADLGLPGAINSPVYVSSWADRITGAYTQTTAANKPLVAFGRNGVPVMRVASTTQPQYVKRDDVALTTGSTGCTFVFVLDNHQYTYSSNLGIAQSKGLNATPGSNSALVFIPGYPNNYSVFNGPAYFNGSPLTPDGVTVIVFRILNGVVSQWVNGVRIGNDLASTPYNITSLQGMLLGGSADAYGQSGFNNSLAADWYLHASYNVALSDATIAKLNTGLVAAYFRPQIIDPRRDTIFWTGDSRIWGFGSEYASGRLEAQVMRSFPGYQSVNGAIPGSQTGSVTTEVSAYVSRAARNGIVVMGAGVNDISGGNTAAGIYANLKAASTAYRAQGSKTVVLTVPTNNNFNSTQKSTLATLNSSITGGSGDFDAVADVAANTTLTVSGSLNTTYAPDGLHFNGAGNAIAAPIVKTAIQSIM